VSEPTYAAAGEESQAVEDVLDDATGTEDLADEADVPEAPQTGDAGVDEAVARLREAVSGPLEGQVAAYDAVHRALQDRLADVEG
jgi:hypothetical protein